MTYFDTDVLVNANTNQNPIKNIESNAIIEQSILDETFTISWLSIQELGFVLAKLNEPVADINKSLNQLIASIPVNYNKVIFERAIELANFIGFKDFNDCLHTAIAEQYCTDFYTYNHADFKKIQTHTFLNIHIL
jgi:predicted nucleic acid-binding protein